MAWSCRIAEKSKLYVKVRADFYPDGRIVPLKFRTEEGEAVRIDQITDVRQAPALKSGGLGTRFTCRVGERYQYLFYDRRTGVLEL